MKNLAPLILLIAVLSGFGQDNPEAILIDEFGHIYCDEFLARVDNFSIQLAANPTSKGYFVISGGRDVLRRKLSVELMFEGAILDRGPHQTRTQIVHGSELGPFKVQMWVVGANESQPNFNEATWNLQIAKVDSPFLLRSDMEQICNPPPFGSVAKRLLEANPDGSIFVLVHGPTARKRQTELRNARKMLSQFNGSRVRYLLRYSGTSYSDYYFAVGKPSRAAFKSYF